MNISSMTGFANQSGEIKTEFFSYSFNIEIKTVNAKGLDTKFKLPVLLEDCENELKTKISSKFSRGTFSVIITLQNELKNTEIQVDSELLSKLTQQVYEIYRD